MSWMIPVISSYLQDKIWEPLLREISQKISPQSEELELKRDEINQLVDLVTVRSKKHIRKLNTVINSRKYFEPAGTSSSTRPAKRFKKEHNVGQQNVFCIDDTDEDTDLPGPSSIPTSPDPRELYRKIFAEHPDSAIAEMLNQLLNKGKNNSNLGNFDQNSASTIPTSEQEVSDDDCQIVEDIPNDRVRNMKTEHQGPHISDSQNGQQNIVVPDLEVPTQSVSGVRDAMQCRDPETVATVTPSNSDSNSVKDKEPESSLIETNNVQDASQSVDTSRCGLIPQQDGKEKLVQLNTSKREDVNRKKLKKKSECHRCGEQFDTNTEMYEHWKVHVKEIVREDGQLTSSRECNERSDKSVPNLPDVCPEQHSTQLPRSAFKPVVSEKTCRTRTVDRSQSADSTTPNKSTGNLTALNSPLKCASYYTYL